MTIREKAGTEDGDAKVAAAENKIDGVAIGLLMDLPDAASPVVAFPENPTDTPIKARTTVPLSRAMIGRQVALLFENADATRPLVIGPLINPAFVTESEDVEAQTDGKRVVIEADKEIVLKCGEASITLTRAGKILLRGAYVSSRSSGANRIKGASVQIN